MLKIIEIENIKGISSKRFVLDVYPNKPSLLVAPNGFGKSSLATAFNSMNHKRILLNEDDFHLEDPSNSPRINIQYQRPDNTIVDLEATNTTNTISNEIDCFVINNNTKPKGNASTYGGHANAKATLIIETVVLVDNIPENVPFNYSYRGFKAKFGVNSGILPNLNTFLNNLKLVECISEKYQEIQRANGVKIQGRINSLIDEINLQNGTNQQLINWIESNKINDLKQIKYLNEIGDLIHKFDIGFDSEVISYLAAIQVIWLYNQDNNIFKNACTYCNYKLDKQQFDTTLRTFNCTWKSIRSSETGGKLVVKFPKAIHISNGQRDILTFISMLFKAKRRLKKSANILIIDEVFDYLDDANLTAAQYYISTFIKEFDNTHKRIYPIILTHLNPNYFKNFAFSNQKVYYLDKSTIHVSPHLIRLLKNRKDATIEDDVSKYLLHYNPGAINKRGEFRTLSIPELWGVGNTFIQHLFEEVANYLRNNPYDPFAVCGGVRVKVEEIAFNKLQSDEARNIFLNTHTTRKKLEEADNMGVISPESHYLLGIIYNEGMHWKENQDNVSPIASKLENLTIKKLIKDVFL